MAARSRAEAGRDSKAGVSKRLVHPTTPRQGGRAPAPTQRPFDSGGSYLASQLSDRGNGPTHRFAQPQRTPLASSKRVDEQSPFQQCASSIFPYFFSFFFFFRPPFASFSTRVHAFRSATILRTASRSRRRNIGKIHRWLRSYGGPSSSERRTSIVGLRPAVRPVSLVFSIFLRQQKCSRRLIEVIGLNRNNPVDASRLVNSLHLSPPPLLCFFSLFFFFSAFHFETS